LSRDPLEEAASTNLYNFVTNNPISLFDILGLFDPELGVAIMFGFGLDNKTGPYISTISFAGSASQGLCDDLYLRADINIRIYTGGLGTSITNTGFFDFEYDLTGSLSGSIGSGEGEPVPSYTLNYYCRSAIDNQFQNSFTYGQALNYNSSVGRTQSGFIGLRSDHFYFNYNNDSRGFPTWGGGSDWSWTGGGAIGLYLGGGEYAETGFQDFTGRYIRRDLRHNVIDINNPRLDGVYDQTQGQLGLNRAEWYMRYGNNQGSITASRSAPDSDWLNIQNLIHDRIDAAHFEYPESMSYRYSISFEGIVKAKQE
jgi:hypothetical protein